MSRAPTNQKSGPAVTLFLGPGGVGKTTLAASFAIASAKRGERVVVLTIDPAARLANALGFASDGLTHQLTTVDGEWPGDLAATMLDPAEMFTSLVTEHSASIAQRDRIIKNPIFVNLLSSLSGTNEYMATERLYELWQRDDVDRIVVDTPPSNHAFDFLDSPRRLTRFLDHQLYRHILRPRKGLLRTLSLASQQMLRLLGGLVGSQLVTDVIDFFSDFDGLDQGFSERAHATEALLTSPGSSYVVVTSPRSEPLREASWIVESLLSRDLSVSAIIGNRTTPTVWEAVEPDLPPEQPVEEQNRLHEILADMRRLSAQEADELRQLATNHGHAGIPLLTIADSPEPMYDLAALEELADLMLQFEALA